MAKWSLGWKRGGWMLTLSRKKHERIIVNGNIVITVVEILGDKVKIGFDAPDEVPIDREEVWISKQAERQRAASHE